MVGLPVIPGYTIISQLAEGGMAKVFLGIQEKLDRKVAIKILDPSLLRQQAFATRFDKEAKTAANLSHSNIITIYDTGQAGDLFYMAMEYLEESLKDRMQYYPDRKMPPEVALDIVKDMMTALDYAHIKGIYHRDIKPDNIMFRSDNTTVLVDFGIARIFESKDELTKSGIIMGSVYYLSPEQCRAASDLDGRCDIYSLGAVLYEMLAGEKPYNGDTQMAIVLKHLQDPIPLLPEELDHFQPLIDQMMAKDKNKRISSLPEFERELDIIIASGVKPILPVEEKTAIMESPPPPTPLPLPVTPPKAREFSFKKPLEKEFTWSFSELGIRLKQVGRTCIQFFKNAPSQFSDFNKDVSVIKKDVATLLWKKPAARKIFLGVLAGIVVIVLGIIYLNLEHKKSEKIRIAKTRVAIMAKLASRVTEQGQLGLIKRLSRTSQINEVELQKMFVQANQYFNEKDYQKSRALLDELKTKKFANYQLENLENKLLEAEEIQFNGYLDNAIKFFKTKNYRKAKEFILKAKALKITEELKLWEDNIETRLNPGNN